MLLAVFHIALPALPISLLGSVAYFMTYHFVATSYVDEVVFAGVFV